MAKVHFMQCSAGDRTFLRALCGYPTDWHVKFYQIQVSSLQNITQDFKQVTCKRCKRLAHYNVKLKALDRG